MRHSITQPLARHKELTGEFVTEPFECAWASEAIYFVRIQDAGNDTDLLRAHPQISADGIHWVDEGSHFPEMSGQGVWFLRLSHFGGWLRLCTEAVGESPRFNIMIHLVVKE
ncbi:hypothetical protein [Aeoliella sp.]|uniref:hypothetical protein n=1 Tax=Aeoliella sp. TaxID=2795800 RepID=UPI003CCC0612